MTLEFGDILNNRYRIVEVLGQGGMGSVYRAIDENLGVEVAVKDNYFTTDDYARQFHREAVILAGLRHANMPRVTDHFVIPGQGQYLVMDYIPGEDLRQRLDRLGVLPEEDVINIGAAICDALTYLGSCNPPIVHRDIKPGNVKINPLGQIFLVDFGLAKVLYGSQITTTGARAMTPGYSPPEQYGTARTDLRSDIYSLGATLYAALTNCVPEDSLSRAVDQVSLTPIRKLNPRVSRRLASAIERALNIRPDHRFQNAEEFKQVLLNARPATRRYSANNNNYEYTVPPPPPSAYLENDPEQGETAQEQGKTGSISKFDARANPQVPLAISPPGKREQPRSRPWRSLIFRLLLILIAGSAVAFWLIPDLPLKAFSFVLGTPTFTPTKTLTADELPPALVRATQIPTFTPSPTSTITPSSTPTISATFTPTLTPTITPTPQPTLIGGSSAQIAYASVRGRVPQIYLLDLLTGEERQITSITEGACQPEWSPDGRQMVFISPCNISLEPFYLGAEMYILNVDEPGAEPILITTQVGGDYDHDWSPDGKWIVFTSERETRRPRIYKLNLETKETTLLSEKFAYEYQPSWSPDGKKIVYIASIKAVEHVYTMNPDGSGKEEFYFRPETSSQAPNWSPDGSVVLFTLYEIGKYVPHLQAVYVNGAERTAFQIGAKEFPNKEADFSPDGLYLVFESWERGGIHDIYTMTINGGSRTARTDTTFLDFDPSWRPNISP